MTKKFTRNIEDFTCENCNASIEGNGYTNHCPICLYSKHVDINPGDRSAICLGLMKPKLYKVNATSYTLEHICLICGYANINKVNKNDSIEEIIKLSRET